MKILKKSFVSRAWLFKGALFAILVMGFVGQSEAQIYTLSQNDSSVLINAGNQQGVYNWSVDGVNQLNQQWFWYSAGGSAPASIDSISAVSATQSSANKLSTTYANSTVSVKNSYSLAAPGNGTATLSETITVQNTSAVRQGYQFFQYSDFNLGGVSAGQSVQFYNNGSSSYYEVIQTGATGSMVETAIAPGASSSEVQAALYPVLLTELNGSSPVNLNNTLFAGPGDVTYAYEWDATLAPGASFQISKLMTVPEPSSMALISSGMLVLALLRRRRGA